MGGWTKFDFGAMTRDEHAGGTMAKAYSVIEKIYTDFERWRPIQFPVVIAKAPSADEEQGNETVRLNMIASNPTLEPFLVVRGGALLFDVPK